MLSLMLLASGLAHATEFFYQPPTGVSAWNLQGGARGGDRRQKDEDGELIRLKINGLYRLGIGYAYGFYEGLSLGVQLTYSDLRLGGVASGHSLGMEPVVLDFRGRETAWGLDVLYSLKVKAGLEKGRLTVDGPANRALGDWIDGYNNGFVVTPKLGITSANGPHHYGLLVAHDIYRRDSTNTFNTNSAMGEIDSIWKGGVRTSAVAFYEWQSPLYILGLDAGWRKQWESKIVETGNTDIQPGFGVALFDVYGNFAVTSALSVLPRVEWVTRAFSDDDHEIDDLRVNLALRYSL